MDKLKKIVLKDEPQENGNGVKKEGGLRFHPTGSGSGGVSTQIGTIFLSGSVVSVDDYSWSYSGTASVNASVQRGSDGEIDWNTLVVGNTTLQISFVGSTHQYENDDEIRTVTSNSSQITGARNSMLNGTIVTIIISSYPLTGSTTIKDKVTGEEQTIPFTTYKDISVSYYIVYRNATNSLEGELGAISIL